MSGTKEPPIGGSTPPAQSLTSSRPRRAIIRRPTWRQVALVVVLAPLAALAWLGTHVLLVGVELVVAQSAVSSVQNGGDATAALRSISWCARAATTAANDPIWRLSEAVPGVGDNLRAVRVASESLDALSTELAVPLLDAVHSSDGRPVLTRVLPIMQSSAPRVAELSTSVSDVRNSPFLISQVRGGLDKVDQVLSVASPALNLMPGMLGAVGPRNYLIVALNNAESVGLGGSASSQTLVRIANGDIEIVAQADSSDYRNYNPVSVQVDESAIALYNDTILRRINATVSRPDFPTAAQLIRAFWRRDIHYDRIDGVISIDPIALSQILTATGPIRASNGQEATSDNIVRLLLNETYFHSTDQKQNDAFFKEIAVSLFGKVASGQFDLGKMLAAARTGIGGGNIMLWSTDPQIQARIATMPIGGVLPTDNEEQTTLGVFFRDHSLGSKIDYYMKSAVVADVRCSAGGKAVFSTSVTLHLDISQEEADKLPAYVKSQVWGSKRFDTEIYVYGPPATTSGAVTLDTSTKTLRKVGIIDLGRPVTSFNVTLRPGESRTVTAEFLGEASEYGPVNVRTTPMVQPTKVSISDTPCQPR